LGLDTYGNIYVVNNNEPGSLAVYTSTGTAVTQWGGFSDANGLAVDAESYVYVGDTGNNLLKKFTSSGSPVTQWSIPLPNGVAVDTNGEIYVASHTNQTVMKLSADGVLLAQCHGFLGPYGVALDANHNVYATDPFAKTVLKFDSNCNFLMSWGGSGTGNGTFGQPEGLAVNSNGWVYVADSTTDLVEIFSPY
jgi:sugar lactone lactonase YvrE